MTDLIEPKVTVLKTFTERKAAGAEALQQAETLTNMGLTDRYGVRVRHVPTPRGKSFWLELVDRGMAANV